MSKNNLIKDFAKIIADRGIEIINEENVNQVPTDNYSFASQIYNNRNVLLPFLVKIATSLKNDGRPIISNVDDPRDKGVIKQFLNRLKDKELILGYNDKMDGCFEVNLSNNEQRLRFFRSEWAEQCFRYVIMKVVQTFCSSKDKPLAYKVFQGAKLKKKSEEGVFTELDLVVQIEKRFYVFEIKSGPWVRIMQWAKREDALVYKGSPVRNITCTIHENIPANIFEPQILISLERIETRLLEILNDDFP